MFIFNLYDNQIISRNEVYYSKKKKKQKSKSKEYEKLYEIYFTIGPQNTLMIFLILFDITTIMRVGKRPYIKIL